jgi:hypothetical protein
MAFLAKYLRTLFMVLSVLTMSTATWPQEASLACRPSGEHTPKVGLYGFVHDNGRRLCVAPKDDADGTDVPCLRVGRGYVGQERADVEEHLGEPWQELESRLPGLSMIAYLVFRDSASATGAYYVVEYERAGDEEIAFSVQLTGDRPEGQHHFSCLNLGDPDFLVTQQLGLPSERSPFEAGDVRGTAWSYGALPVSIEIVDGKVYSMRVWRPDDVPPQQRRLSLIDPRG